MRSPISKQPRTASHLPLSRRRLIQAGVASCVAGGWIGKTGSRPAIAAPPERDLRIAEIERITVRVPYREIPERNMNRELPHWRYSEICKVTLQSGDVGCGETLLYYTWGATEDGDVARVRGRNAATLMWDDSLGAGLQMALFDAVARACGVPIHRLLGEQVHGSTPLSWWNIDTSAEDMAAECWEAHRQGYTAYKTKGRPWFDVWEQVAAASRRLPRTFKIDMDFNDTLLDAPRAIPILKDLEAYPQVGIFETPIFQHDVPGNRAICQATNVPIAMHYGEPDPLTAAQEGVCDGFIINGGATQVLQRGAFSAAVEKPFWLQLVGTGITAAWSLHFGAVLVNARWPAVNCHQLYRHDLLLDPIVVRQGFAAVPDRPGLGHRIDWDAIERFRVEKPARRPDPPRLIETSWPDGRRMFTANTGKVNFMLDAGRTGKFPFYVRGAQTRLVPNDGSDEWRERYEQARRSPPLLAE